MHCRMWYGKASLLGALSIEMLQPRLDLYNKSIAQSETVSHY